MIGVRADHLSIRNRQTGRSHELQPSVHLSRKAQVSQSKSFRKSDQLMILSLLFLPKQDVSFSSLVIEKKAAIGVRHDSRPRTAESTAGAEIVAVTADSDLVRTVDHEIRRNPVGTSFIS